MQCSLAGLLQSLLYDIWRQCPQMFPLIYPSRWDNQGGHDALSSSWEYSELTEAFSMLIKQHFTDLRFCLFIDGLVEYRGDDHADVIDVLNRLTASSYVKLCVSSRP